MNQTPASQGFRQPAEWKTHKACWLAYPYNVKEWGTPLAAAQQEFVALCEAIADIDPLTKEPRGEQLEVLAANFDVLEQARHALANVPSNFHLIPYDDIWLRDSAPIFVARPEGQTAAVQFQFNVWGHKFELPQDEEVAANIAKGTGLQVFEYPFVLEGGSVETDGEGTCLTTRQCLLNPNRNPNLDQDTLEQFLKFALGYEKILWLDEGLINDHTDGHIDTLVRFVAPGVVICMVPKAKDDPNAAALKRIASALSAFTDAKGRKLQMVTIPSPGLVLDEEGEAMPASYVNFYIGNRTVVVPTYGTKFDAIAVKAISACFPTRRTVGLSAKAILTGGGAFHCITQQQP
jgi:agmatine deiminase